MTIDLTDWAALLEALDGIRGKPPSPPPLPLPLATQPRVPAFAAARATKRRRDSRQPFAAMAMSRSQ